MVDVIAVAWRAEESLLTAGVRGNAAQLAELLAPDFYEIGQSGRRFSRDEIVTALLADTESDEDAVVTEREATLINSETVLLSYRLEFGSRVSRRSSLWRWDGRAVGCLFHQGTPSR